MLTGKVNVVISDDFIVLDSADARVAGLLNASFTKKLYNPSGTEVSGSIAVTVTGLGNGTYRASYTPNAAGLWELDIVHATYNVAGWSNSHQIFTNDYDSIATAVWAVATRTLTSFGTLASDVWAVATRTLSAFAFSVAVSDKTGFSLSATGADLILKSSTFIQAIVAAINEFATYGLTALNTLLVTTGIKAASIPAATLADNAITSDKFDESTAFPLKSDDSGATKIARTGADSDTLETLSDELVAGFLAGAKEASIDDVKGTGFVKNTDSLVNLSHGGSGLSKQDVRDAMALSTLETPATGSVDKYIADISEWTELSKDIESGGWEITGNQMIFYKPDNVTELFRVNLIKAGVPSEDSPDKRTRV